jgi:hypothetical protein
MRRRCNGVYAISEWKRSPPMMCGSGYNAERAGSRSELEMLLNNVYAKNCAHLIENVLLSLARIHPPAVCVVCRYLVGEP